jgi:D-alanyl-D-alanine carboxypeptidase/D-alanyl-D-alanine-endopeptidase (penicillin-binding protein 4)
MLAAVTLALLNPRLDALLDSPELKGAVVSAMVTDMDGAVLYERNAAMRVMPASNQKLIACAYALHRLGPDFVPKTRIWRERDRTVVESNGDPSLNYGQLLNARRTLRLNMKNPVHVKQAYRVGIPASWEQDDLPNRYAAPVSAFCFDQAAFELWAERGKAFLRPSSFGVKIITDLRLKKGASAYDPIRKVVRVGPSLPVKRTRLDTLALPSADETAASMLGTGMFSTNSVPARKPDLVIEGQKLPEILKTCLVKSDNIMAENLFLMAAHAEGANPLPPSGASGAVSDVYEIARERATKFLTGTVGIDPIDLRIYDGSGLSRHNLVNARAISKLLSWAAMQPTAEVWRASLVSPLNGTLRGRLKDVAFQGKTGTLDMVVSLSGYVKGKDGNERIMSLILNHFTSPSSKAREIVDSFAKVVEEGVSGTPSALSGSHEASRFGSVARHLPIDWYWIVGPGIHRSAARAGSDYGTEPAHEAAHRVQRVALRAR